ncbi:hypothetical protein OEG84_23045 [Hoeflea sp. G2-23]|uniref:Uncharacterized protein n=1 Tax=Hoeflea algicola TaxID=2983763 RepID=A0ABT3ZFN5_9HYPH|nr:hypothetical protein [Hoeflea algicola]MCY0150503.1 hypothetical protein [Hoeflea algicola]
MNKTIAVAAIMLTSLALPASAGPMPSGASSLPVLSLVLTIAANTNCEGLKTDLDAVQDDRDAYNGNEENWALKDEIRDLDERLEGIRDEMSAASCP